MRVLVFNDEPDVIEVVRLTFNLRWPEAEAMPAPTGSEGVESVRRDSPKIIILAARHDEVDKVTGLEPGGDPAGTPMIMNERGVGYEFARRDQAPSRAGREGCAIR